MPAELLTRNGRASSPPVQTSTGEDELRDWARQHLERVRRLKLHVAAFVLGLVVLTPVWALAEWQSNGGFERWSDNSQPGDWEPWILYVALVWGLVVAIAALKVYFDRPTSEAEIDRAVERLTSRR
ncbi:MAG TPA: 2TM domain-containing protein [Gaiellaceae bacterium]|nr:2TM domain-containing protein [Gaiellaceae bacterium]